MYCSINNNLYSEAIKTPMSHGAKKLLIVTGYSSPAIVHKVFKDAKDASSPVSVELIIGMAKSKGAVSSINHKDFLQLQEEKSFSCRYVNSHPLVHAKLYIWLDEDDNILFAFGGSANFSIQGLIGSQVEILSKIDPALALNFFENIKQRSDAVDTVDLTNFSKVSTSLEEMVLEEEEESIKLTLLNSKNMNETPSRSGLNWGQRPDQNREPNQGYINIPARINRQKFFPEKGIPFIIQTDDNKTLAVVRAQDGGKGLETYENNSILGRYFRERLGLQDGQFVTKAHLERYGRTDVTIRKLDEETYYMDFSVN